MACATGTPCSSSPELNAFFARVERSLPKLYSRALRAFPGPLVDARDADDLVQETLVRAMQQQDKYTHSSDAQWQQWLMTIMHNCACNSRKRDALARRLGGGGRVGEGTFSNQQAAERGDATILKSLPEPERSIVYKHVVEESSWKDLGAEFQMSPEALRKRFERALWRLRESVGRY